MPTWSIPFPTRACPRAIGYAAERGVPFEMGLIRSHYVGRTFIEPQESIRHFGVRLKLNPVEPVLRGKRVVVIDDSIVRGTTSRKIVKMVRDAGAREVHLRISSPPTQWPCYYGIDTPTRRELIASSHSVDEIARYVTADSLGYLSLDGMLRGGGRRPTRYCHACFSGSTRSRSRPTRSGRCASWASRNASAPRGWTRQGRTPPGPPTRGVPCGTRRFPAGSAASVVGSHPCSRRRYLSPRGAFVSLKTFPSQRRLSVAALAAAAACSSSSSPQATTAPPTEAGASMPFKADPPYVYVAKVKDVLVGLPPTDAEIQQVEADPSQLATLIAGWQQLPEYTAKMTRFFELAYQQTQITAADFADQAYPRQIDVNGSTEGLLLQNMQESFARTMIALTQQNQPLTQGITTHQLMMTTALKETYAYLDAWEVDDNSKTTDYWKMANPNVSLTIEASQGPIPISESVDPTSPNYMHFYDPDVGGAAANMVAGCNNDPIVLSGGAASGSALHYLLYGTIVGWTGTGGGKCLQYSGSSKSPQMQPSDFSDWTMVTISQPASGQATTAFYDLPSLRSATQLVLRIPRTGFFSTPAFAANWQTNTSNMMRVTTNQALIVGLGSSIDGTDMTLPPTTPGLDTTHADQAACYTCHRLLDPTRSVLAATWSWNYHSPARSDVRGPAGPLRLPRRHRAGEDDRRLRQRHRDAPPVPRRVGAEALLLCQLVGLRRRATPSSRRS